MNTFRIVCDILATVAVGTYIYFLLRWHNENMTIYKSVSKKLDHLYKLCDVLVDGCFSAPHRSLYAKYRELGPFNQPKTKREEFEIMKGLAVASYLRGRKIIIDAMNAAEDPEGKKFFEQKLKETDSIFNLMETIDENSSEDYIKSVLADVNSSIKKLFDMERIGE
jgi:hypothetical protein